MHLTSPQLPLQLCFFQVQFSPPRKDHVCACEGTSIGCGRELSPCSFPRPSWAPATLVRLWICVGVTWVAKCWGFQLAAVACVGEGTARGQTRTGSPCRCAIWLLRSGMCFALLFQFVLSEVLEVSLAGLRGPSRSRAAAFTHRNCPGWVLLRSGCPL